ncbi:MAG: hypothetical protein ABSA83_21550 [Verrucomicrobiota bacterium]
MGCQLAAKKFVPFPFPAGESEAKQTKPVIRMAPRIRFKPSVSRRQIKGLFGPHDGGNAVEPQRIGVYAAFEAASIAYLIAPVDFDVGNLRPGFEGDKPTPKIMAKIQDGVAGLKDRGCERFGHGEFLFSIRIGDESR